GPMRKASQRPLSSCTAWKPVSSPSRTSWSARSVGRGGNWDTVMPLRCATRRGSSTTLALRTSSRSSSLLAGAGIGGSLARTQDHGPALLGAGVVRQTTFLGRGPETRFLQETGFLQPSHLQRGAELLLPG